MKIALAFALLYVCYGVIHLILRKLPGQWYVALLYFFMLKMLFNYDKCTLSYVECRLRGVSKESGYLYRFVNGFIELRNMPIICGFLVLYTLIFSIYYFKAGGRFYSNI